MVLDYDQDHRQTIEEWQPDPTNKNQFHPLKGEPASRNSGRHLLKKSDPAQPRPSPDFLA
jgi:hypothetical protein